MKKNSYSFWVILLVAFGGLLLSRCGSGADTVEGQVTGYNNADLPPDSLCFAKPDWFPHTQTPAPLEGIGSPFDTNSTTNSIFHQWSWQKFLWLTKPLSGGEPLFLNPDSVYQITSTMQRVNAPSGTMIQLTDIHQAGPGSPILQSNPAYNSGSGDSVFYSLHMNPKMFDASVTFAQKIKNGQIPDSNGVSFPVGSFEMKVSWIPLSAIPQKDHANYYTTMASLSMDGGKTFKNTEVAMLGMHIVGIVQNHPEFIWATFEHDDLAPDYDWKANTASSTTDQLLFKSGSVTGINGIRYNKATQLGVTPYQVFDLFQYGVPRNPGGDFMATSQAEPVNFNNVEGINQCVKSQLTDVWKNYFYNGSLWLNMDGRTPEQQVWAIDSLGYDIAYVTPGSLARGSTNCANVSMESFTQTFKSDISQISASNLANCFSCHTPVANSGVTRSPLYLSHSFQDYLGTVQGQSKTQVETTKASAEGRMLIRMTKKK